VLDKLTTGNVRDDGVFKAPVYVWNGGGLDMNILYNIASGEKSHNIGKKFKLEAVYKHCVKYPQIVRLFHADIRALARTPVAAVTPARATQGS
jgi:hypothetical protein